MRRLPKTHKKLPMKKEDEPDFYALDKKHPLPSLEESPLPTTTIVPTAIRPQQSLGGGLVPHQMHGMSSPSAMPSAFHSLTSSKDAFESRDPLMGMSGMTQARPSSGYGSMAMGNMGMSAMGGMSAMNGMNTMGGINGMNGMGNMNAMNGMNNLRESSAFQSQGMGDFGSAFGGQSMDQFQRLRQLQQMQLLERQMGNPSITGLGGDPFSMMQADTMGLRMNRQPC